MRTLSTLLIVDDEPGVRTVISRWGESHGYNVVEADSADAALRQMHDCPADIALCDLHLPGLDGRWLVNRLSEQFPGTAVLMTTGIDEAEAAAKLPDGAIACLVKPFTFDQLETLLDRALDWQLDRATARLWKQD
jgi:DNA-binding NtrC family response regulator